jgi:hypothetical protein
MLNDMRNIERPETEEQIKTLNKLIAAFMGFPFYYENIFHAYGGPIEGDILELGDIICREEATLYESHEMMMIADADYTRVPFRWYNRSWDELIPVIQKIRENRPKKHSPSHLCMEYPIYLQNIEERLLDLDIEEVWEEVADFMVWYNKYKDEEKPKMKTRSIIVCDALQIDIGCELNDSVDIRCGGPAVLGYDFYVSSDEDEKNLETFLKNCLRKYKRNFMSISFSIKENFPVKDLWTREKMEECIKTHGF